ncbi:hypothetical protein [Myxosarcina sp. GI1]|uniref:hypothetical protein n=1 Tax=Myxosarcina sp. GI1 TaxID=1541065 RepID=UPI00068E3A30|nr:hypothetical protein [Myxosarcina sp. GI1]
MTQTQNISNRNPDDLVNNQEPIAGDDPAYEQIFKDLQGGIIKNYGRKYFLYIFVRFAKNRVSEVKEWIREEISSSITSTWKQLEDTKKYREKKQDNPSYAGELCRNFFLSYQGYYALEFNPAKPNNEEAKINDTLFNSGMNQDWENKYRLKMPPEPPNDYWYNPPEKWDFGGKKGKDDNWVDALILLAHDDLSELKQEAETIIARWEKLELGKVVACEAGYVLRNENRQAIGPFGFADGISQPLFLKGDYERYQKSHSISQWNPFASLNLVLVKDPFSESYSYGSYCVFQKLETNYELFEKKVGELAETLGSDRKRASALVVGRFKNGTPIALSDRPNKEGDRHSFNYADDPNGSKCPLHAHIRQVNPRKHEDNADLAKSRKKKRIFRAGITYFDDPTTQQASDLSSIQQCLNKLDYLNNKVSKQSLTDNVKSISGLLFVCFQSNILFQFSELQRTWADTNFPKEDAPKHEYLDPIIGHPAIKNGKIPSSQKWAKNWGKKEKFVPYSFCGCVKNRGGEFLFAPSISFLKNLT